MEKIISYEKQILMCLNVTCKIGGVLLLLIVIYNRNTTLLPVGAITFLISSFGCFAVFYDNRSLLFTYSILLFLFLTSQIIIVCLYLLELSGYQLHSDLLFQKMYTFSNLEWTIATITVCVQIMAASLAVHIAKMLHDVRDERLYDNLERELQDTALIVQHTS